MEAVLLALVDGALVGDERRIAGDEGFGVACLREFETAEVDAPAFAGRRIALFVGVAAVRFAFRYVHFSGWNTGFVGLVLGQCAVVLTGCKVGKKSLFFKNLYLPKFSMYIIESNLNRKSILGALSVNFYRILHSV